MDQSTRTTNARRRLIATLTAGTATAAVGALMPRWTKPIVKSVTLPAHAQATGVEAEADGPPPLVNWAYDNTAQLQQDFGDGTGFGTGPCADMTGPWIPTTPFAQVAVQCNGQYRITGWIIDGVDVIGTALDFGATGSCPGLLESLADAMNTVDQEGNWERDSDGIDPSEGGCGQYVVSRGTVGTIVYGPMTVEDRDDTSSVWTLFPRQTPNF